MNSTWLWPIEAQLQDSGGVSWCLPSRALVVGPVFPMCACSEGDLGKFDARTILGALCLGPFQSSSCRVSWGDTAIGNVATITGCTWSAMDFGWLVPIKAASIWTPGSKVPHCFVMKRSILFSSPVSCCNVAADRCRLYYHIIYFSFVSSLVNRNASGQKTTAKMTWIQYNGRTPFLKNLFWMTCSIIKLWW